MIDDHFSSILDKKSLVTLLKLLTKLNGVGGRGEGSPNFMLYIILKPLKSVEF